MVILPNGLRADDPGLFFFLPVRVEQTIWRKRVAVRPTVYGDAFDVLCGIETCATKHASQLVADFVLELRKKCLQEFVAARAILVALRQPRLAGRAKHEQHDGFIWIAREMVLPEANGKIQRGVSVITAGHNNVMHVQLRMP